MGSLSRTIRFCRGCYQLHAANPNIKVSISAEMMSTHGDVISLLDKVRLAQIEKVGYQIRAAPPTSR